MAVDRQHGKIIFSCDDGCDETFEGDTRGTFDEAWAAAKAEGWFAHKVGKDWVHRCPECGA